MAETQVLINSGTQAQINVTTAQEEILTEIINFSNGTKGLTYVSIADLEEGLPTSLIMRIVDANGAPTGAETTFILPASGFLSGEISDGEIVALANGNFAIVYDDDGTTGPSSPGTLTAVRFQLYGSSGAAIGGPVTIANGQTQVYVFSSSVASNPGGGFDVSVSEFGTVFDIDLYSVSNTGVVSSEIQTTSPAVDFAYTPSGGRITGSAASQAYVVDFPGVAPPVSYSFSVPNGSSGSILDTYLRAESSTSAVLAAEHIVFVQNSSTVQSRSIQLVRFTDGQSAQLLATISLTAGTAAGDDSLSDFIILADGSFVVGYFVPSPPGIGMSELRHFSSTGASLGSAELLNPAGSAAGAVQLTQLADGRVMAAYSGITGATGGDLEVFRELFTISGTGPSTTPTTGNNSLTGTSGNDVIDGLAGDDTISGGAGADLMIGGTGSDSMTGGDGSDVYYVDNVGDAVIETNAVVATGGFDTVYSTVNFTLGANVEQLVMSVNAAVGTGNAGANTFDATQRGGGVTLSGFDGNDVFYGSNYADSIVGGNQDDILIGYFSVGGADTLVGGAGNDVYYLFETGDTITELANEGLDTVYSQANVTLSANFEQLIVYGAATTGTGSADNNNIFGNNSSNALTLDGQGGNDWIIGGTGNDTLTGGAGNDQLQGLAGTNTMQGGANDDQYFSTSSTDIITENLNEGFDTVYASYNVAALAANVEQLSVSGGVGVANGNGLANVIYANNNSVGTSINADAGADIIYGSGFADTILGGLGNDTMQGAGGADRFTYASGNMGADLITDFADGSDLMVLSGLGYTSGSIGSAITISGGANALVTFVSGSLTGTTITLLGVNQANVAAADFVF